MESNIYTTKIYDIIVSEEAIVTQDSVTETNGDDFIKICMKTNNNGQDQESTYVNLQKLTHLFIVMELGETDFKNLISNSPRN